MQFHASPDTLNTAAAVVDNVVCYGVNPATAAKDDRAWDMWLRVCTYFKTAPIRSLADVKKYPERITFLLTALMMYVRMYCRPRNNDREFIKPKSCLAYPLAIIRIYKRWGITLPGIKPLLACLQGMCRAYIVRHGSNSLTPHKAEPMKFCMARAIFDIADNTVVNGTLWRDEDPKVFSLKRAVLFSMSSGTRLSSLAAGLAAEETTHLVKDDASYTISNVVVVDPSEEQLESMRDGDTVTIRPARAKCDQWLELHANFPHTFTFRKNDPYNVAGVMRDLELKFPCRGAKRKHTALFCNAEGNPYPHNFYNSYLRSALTHLYGPKVASIYSWHSFRSGLATALHAAGVPDSVILLICHWVSPESLRSYRRLTYKDQDNALTAAANVPVSLLQPHNAPIVSGDQHYAALLAELQGEPPAPADKTPPKRAREQPRVATATKRAAAPPIPPTRSPSPVKTLGKALDTAPEAGTTLGGGQDVWPKVACSELQGAGWEVEVVSSTSITALVQFKTARTSSGRPFQRVRLPLSTLHRIAILPVDNAEDSQTRSNNGSTDSAALNTATNPSGNTPRRLTAPRGRPNVRGGCAGSLQPPAPAAEAQHPQRVGAPEAASPLKPGTLNASGYPQLVASDICALCKLRLDPLSAEGAPSPPPPTNVPTPERLQCERCGLVRYCSAWCAHVHYMACHSQVCPLPDFSSHFNAEYVERQGDRVFSIPVNAVRTELMLGGKFPSASDHAKAGRTHVWTVVPHRASASLDRAFECDWCMHSLTDPKAPPLHNIWFVACITRLRPVTPPQALPLGADLPGLCPPLTIYPSAPPWHGDPNESWPSPDPMARWPIVSPAPAAATASVDGVAEPHA